MLKWELKKYAAVDAADINFQINCQTSLIIAGSPDKELVLLEIICMILEFSAQNIKQVNKDKMA